MLKLKARLLPRLRPNAQAASRQESADANPTIIPGAYVPRPQGGPYSPPQALRTGGGQYLQRLLTPRPWLAGLLTLLLAGRPNWARAQDLAGAMPDSTFHLYLLMGQSNMAGRGTVTPELSAVGSPAVYMLSALGQWVPAHHPVHFDKPTVAGVGPGLSFGMALAAADPGVRIGLVPCAVGGTSINKWQPGAFDEATQTYPYDDAARRITVAMRYGVVKGMIWHQGEADSNPAAAAAYLPKLTELIGRVRALTGQPKLPVVAGELGRFKENYQTFNAQLLKLPPTVPHTALATSEGLVDKGDHTHFDGASADEYGRRYAAQMLALQQSTPTARKTRKSKANPKSRH